MHILNLNCPKLPFANSVVLNNQFMTIDSLKLKHHCNLTPQLDVGIQIDRKCHTDLHMYVLDLKCLYYLDFGGGKCKKFNKCEGEGG